MPWLFKKPQSKKALKGKCSICGKYGHKAADCYETRSNLDQEKKNFRKVFQQSEHEKNGSNSHNKPMWMQSDPRRTRKFDKSKVRCFECQIFGHLAKECRSKIDHAHVSQEKMKNPKKKKYK